MRTSACIVSVAAAAALSLAAGDASAVRPFVTDDARVVGGRAAQLETWVRLDRSSVQHWVLLGFGPLGPLELTIGGVHGGTFGDSAPRYGLSGPLGQAKLLFWEPRPNGIPGVAVVAGGLPPVGIGPFETRGWDFFEYVAVSESLGERDRVLIHANVGVFGSTDPAHGGVLPTWGVGTQVRVAGGFHGIAEVFSGDPYAGGGGVALQVGFRHIVSAHVQLDGTCGTGLAGAPPLAPWGSVGLRLASDALW